MNPSLAGLTISAVTGKDRPAATGVTMGPIRILIADDHAIIRRGLRTLLEHEPGFEVIAEACDGRQAIEAALRERPHVVILDIGMPNLNGIEAARQISATLHDTQIVVLTVHADECYLLSALRAGARGYVLKSSAESEIVDAVRAVSQGKAFFSPKVSRILADDYTRYLQREDVEDAYELLTNREREILQLLAEGAANKDVANVLGLSPTTVISHRQHIFQKLNLHSVADLILYAVRKGVIPPQRSGAAPG
ncbi:MAG TPA: response regulator transcription factor [Bryobacteraceae bacterium]|nr:response regulator transcription factor [Bryobacteraceae bacterium]